jgi:hypothetical protein
LKKVILNSYIYNNLWFFLTDIKVLLRKILLNLYFYLNSTNLSYFIKPGENFKTRNFPVKLGVSGNTDYYHKNRGHYKIKINKIIKKRL